MRQGVNHRDVCVDLNRLTVQDRWPVPPFTNGGECGLEKQRVTRDCFERLDRTVGGDDGAKFDASLKAHLPGQRRIDGLHAVDEHGCLHWSADSLADGGSDRLLARRRRFNVRLHADFASLNPITRRRSRNYRTLAFIGDGVVRGFIGRNV